MKARSLGQFAELVGGEVTAGMDQEPVRGAAVDTRKLEPGQAFFAIKGARTDGHDHCADALAAGASCAVVTRGVDVAIPQIRVHTAEEALATMARGLIAEWAPTVLAITGSVGKTSVKGMIGRIASRRWSTAVAPGNLNSELGMPLAVANADHDAELLVLEFAMRGQGQIRELGQMVPPHVSVVTNVGVSHLEILGSRQAIAEAKREIYETTRPDGTACLPLDDDFSSFLRDGIRCAEISFGIDEAADVRGSEVRQTEEGTALLIRHAGRSVQVHMPVPGAHHARNAVAATAGALALGANLRDVVGGLDSFEPEPHRGQLIKAPGGFEIIDDCYNASPESMRAALAVLEARPCSGRRVAVLGDMLELGPVSEQAHLELGREIERHGVYALVTVGERGELIARGATEAPEPVELIRHHPARDDASRWLRDFLDRGDVVLVKASRGLELEHLIDSLTGGGGER
ncbi:MAG: UDP-N-acetylmuramoyl-tripeptide--D-alanyl-D-alanine ligase [Armatimonadia bacterium]|nr:UDP-N-acetylmuramoyl-tripeptide--D-alanyl-D-alanine ligase [Armatimonadia bacterium]